MPGTYNIRKARATIQHTYTKNQKIREERLKKVQEGIAERAEIVSSFLRAKHNHYSGDIDKYLGHK